jgi:flagellar hook protein FlgE
VGVNIDGDGFVIASFSNGETQKIYKLPIADFANPNGLQAITGNVFAETAASGDVNLREAGKNGAGDVVSNALEASNVDLAQQLTDMIVAQRAYQSNTRVITTADQLLEKLTQI